MDEGFRPARTHEEIKLGQDAAKAAKKYVVWAGVLVVIAAIAGGAAGVSVPGAGLIGFLIGAISGFLVGIANFHRVEAKMLDMQRRQMFMDRT